MNKIILFTLLISTLAIGCDSEQKKNYSIAGKQSKIIIELIEAVKEKDAEKYTIGFADNVQVYVESQVKINGRKELIDNRAKHFQNHPNVRSEIQHLVEIDNKVIMHDKVWLNDADKAGQNIVEIFTFENDKVIRVDVIQPNDLFRN